MPEIAVSEDLSDLYEGYYHDNGPLEVKRALAARDSVIHIRSIWPNSLGRTIDVGSGNGAVIQELIEQGLSHEITALEISASGLEAIKGRNLEAVKEVVQFDGYKIPFADQHFDSAICIHVLEHVEHERVLLKEIGRVAKEVFIEIPLEGGFRGRINYAFGHINYYSPLTARAILETSGLEIVRSKVVASSKELEQFVHGKNGGLIRSILRKSLLALFGARSAEVMTFLYIAHCRAK